LESYRNQRPTIGAFFLPPAKKNPFIAPPYQKKCIFAVHFKTNRRNQIDLFETDIKKPSTVAVWKLSAVQTPDVGMKCTPTEGFLFITNSYIMHFNKNFSPAQTQKERNHITGTLSHGKGGARC